MDQEKMNKYSNGEINIEWRQERCTHAAKCVGNLPQVYRPGEKPWIKIENASTEELVEQIKTCPSGALTYTTNK